MNSKFWVLFFIIFGREASATDIFLSDEVTTTQNSSHLETLAVEIIDQILSYVEYKDPLSRACFGQASRSIYTVTNLRQEEYKIQHFYTYSRKILSLRDKANQLNTLDIKTTPPDRELLGNILWKLNYFTNVIQNCTIDSLGRLRGFLKNTESFKEIINDYRFNFRDLIFRINFDRIPNSNEKSSIASLREQGKSLKMGAFFFKELNKLESDYTVNIENYLKNEKCIKAKMLEIWQKSYSKFAISSVTELKNFKKNFKKIYKDNYLPNPFYTLEKHQTKKTDLLRLCTIEEEKINAQIWNICQKNLSSNHYLRNISIIASSTAEKLAFLEEYQNSEK